MTAFGMNSSPDSADADDMPNTQGCGDSRAHFDVEEVGIDPFAVAHAVGQPKQQKSLLGIHTKHVSLGGQILFQPIGRQARLGGSCAGNPSRFMMLARS